MSKLKHVAVIGAGPAGLCAARHLLHSNINSKVSIKPVVFEQNEVVGGTWVYEDVVEDTKQKLFSSIYANLKTNLPKQVMVFPDFPFPDNVPTYMHHSDVRKYLEDYADCFQLKNHIRFDTEIVKLSPILKDCTDIRDSSSERFIRWNVLSKRKSSGETFHEEYDAVIICNGHYSIPSYVPINGLDNFEGEIMHSHYYRHPSVFRGKDVLILGCGPSGLDIMVELSKYCRSVSISHRRDRIKSWLPENVKEYPNISYVNDSGHFVFDDSSTAIVDSFIPCTGYILSFPFITEQSRVDIKYNTITNLYKHIFNIKYPSLSFVGLTWQNTPLPALHQQCQYIMKIISEIKKLPTSEVMYADTEAERKERLDSGELRKYFHRMGDRQWNYNRDIALLAGNKENPPIIENLYRYAMNIRNKELCFYKNREFKAINDSEFIDLSAT